MNSKCTNNFLIHTGDVALPQMRLLTVSRISLGENSEFEHLDQVLNEQNYQRFQKKP